MVTTAISSPVGGHAHSCFLQPQPRCSAWALLGRTLTVDSAHLVIYPRAIPMGSSLPHFLAKFIVTIPDTCLFRNPQHPYILKPEASRYLMPLSTSVWPIRCGKHPCPQAALSHFVGRELLLFLRANLRGKMDLHTGHCGGQKKLYTDWNIS